MDEFCGPTSTYKFNQDDVSSLLFLFNNIFLLSTLMSSLSSSIPLYVMNIRKKNFLQIKIIFIHSHFCHDQDIDFEGFQKFIDLFLDCETPLELSQHLFLSFLRPYQSQLSGNSTLNCMAAVSSNAACVPVISHNTRGTLLMLYS